MLFSSITALALAGAAIASPIERRNNTGSSSSSSGITDAVVLNYALTLEHLEATFYREGLQKFDAAAFESAGFPEWVRLRISEIASQEATHVSFLTSALKAAGATPVAECKYNFGNTSPATFLAIAQVLEGVGVSAYLGAAASISNKQYLTVAASILSVEARHTAWIRGGAQQEDSFPNTFDTPLGFSQVYSLAAPFFVSCPSSNPTLPVKAFPALTASKAAASPGDSISFSSSVSGAKYVAQVNATGATYTEYTGNGTSVTLPSQGGQNYFVLTSSKAVTDDATVAGPAIVEVAVPATLFSV